MTDDSNELATKNDLKQLEDNLTADIKDTDDRLNAKIDTVECRLSAKMTELQSELTAKMEDIKDQILRAFGLTEESIRKDCAHVDEVAGIEQRLSRVEKHVGVEAP